MIEQWGLGYEAFREHNPGIIYAQASGMGPQGPEASRPMFDIVAQALGGIMSVNGEEGRAPTPVGTFIADQMGATMLAVAILAALVARERTGKGQCVDVSLLGSQIATQSYEITDYLLTRNLPRRAGRGHPHSGVLWNTFPAADGYFAVAGVREDRWPEFCHMIGAHWLIDDPRFDQHQARNENREALLRELDAVFVTQPRDHWIAVLSTLNIACGPVRTYDEVARDPQVLANGYITEMDHPTLGRVQLVNTPISFSETPSGPKGPSPELGQHTEEVLLEMGLDWPEILRLREAGAI
jgi:crotonobetainyl-CoA:carnitine CoA-transferase CaiB-like acyl-CoA transferase